MATKSRSLKRQTTTMSLQEMSVNSDSNLSETQSVSVVSDDSQSIGSSKDKWDTSVSAALNDKWENAGVVLFVCGILITMYSAWQGSSNPQTFGDSASSMGANIASYACGRMLHEKEKKLSKKLHKNEKELARKLHRRDSRLNRRIHLIQMFVDLEQNEHQLNGDLMLAIKEAQRDMFDASNQKLQTLILAATVMFGALSTVMIQGQLPDNPPPWVVSCMGIFGGLSFSGLFASIVCCMELLHRTSKFMMSRGSDYDKRSREILTMKKHYDDELKEQHRAMLNKDYKALHSSWRSHERGIYKRLEYYSAQRSYVFEGGECFNGDDGYPTIRYNEVPEVSFTEFWSEDCRVHYTAAEIIFYFGTWCMLATTAVYLFAQFETQFSNELGATVCLWCCLATLFFMPIYTAVLRWDELRELFHHQPKRFGPFDEWGDGVIGTKGAGSVSNKVGSGRRAVVAAAGGGRSSSGKGRRISQRGESVRGRPSSSPPTSPLGQTQTRSRVSSRSNSVLLPWRRRSTERDAEPDGAQSPMFAFPSFSSFPSLNSLSSFAAHSPPPLTSLSRHPTPITAPFAPPRTSSSPLYGSRANERGLGADKNESFITEIVAVDGAGDINEGRGPAQAQEGGRRQGSSADFDPFVGTLSFLDSDGTSKERKGVACEGGGIEMRNVSPHTFGPPPIHTPYQGHTGPGPGPALTRADNLTSLPPPPQATESPPTAPSPLPSFTAALPVDARSPLLLFQNPLVTSWGYGSSQPLAPPSNTSSSTSSFLWSSSPTPSTPHSTHITMDVETPHKRERPSDGGAEVIRRSLDDRGNNLHGEIINPMGSMASTPIPSLSQSQSHARRLVHALPTPSPVPPVPPNPPNRDKEGEDGADDCEGSLMGVPDPHLALQASNKGPKRPRRPERGLPVGACDKEEGDEAPLIGGRDDESHRRDEHSQGGHGDHGGDGVRSFMGSFFVTPRAHPPWGGQGRDGDG